MFKLDNPFNITYFAVSIALIAVFAAVSIVRLSRPSRKRNLTDGLFIAFNVLCLILAVVASLFMIVQDYSVFGLGFVQDGGALVFVLNNIVLLKVPEIGFILNYTQNLALAGQIIPFALTLLTLLCFILVLAKTKRVKNKLKSPPTPANQVLVQQNVAELSNDGTADAADIQVVKNEFNGLADNEFRKRQDNLDSFAQESTTMRTSNDFANTNDLLQQNRKGDVFYAGAKHILGEIDLLVTLASENLQVMKADESQPELKRILNVRKELERAISEGLAMKERYGITNQGLFEKAPPFNSEGAAPILLSGEYELKPENKGDEGKESDVNTQESVQTQVSDGKDSLVLKDTKLWSVKQNVKPQNDEREVEAERLQVRKANEKVELPIETDYETANNEQRPVNYSDILLQARARTITRRPSEKTVVVTQSRSEKKPREKNSPIPAAQEQDGKEAKQKKTTKSQSADVKRKTGTESKKKEKKTEKADESVKPDAVDVNEKARMQTVGAKSVTVSAIHAPVREKVVRPLESALPLTKRYIILNRQSAANVFGEYLKQKEADDKSALKKSLNTIFLK